MFKVLNRLVGRRLLHGTVSAPAEAPADGCAKGNEPSLPIAEPTVFHITHWKAGSQWIHRMLHMLIYDRLVLPGTREQVQFFKMPIQPGKVYPTVYVTKEEFESVVLPSNCRRFVIFRDLRDTLVSLYFSIKVSHVMPTELAWNRDELQNRDQEAGLLYTLGSHLPLSAAIQESWARANEPLLRYEDLLQDDLAILTRVLLEQCELRVTPERFREVVLACRFESVTGGRPRGQEDLKAHERKGISGDWRNYFSPRLKKAFKERFGDLLIATGYEKNLDW